MDPANIATTPVAFAALLRAFNDSPYVGLQMDPSHLAWRMEPATPHANSPNTFSMSTQRTPKSSGLRCAAVGFQPVDNPKWWRLPLIRRDQFEQLFSAASPNAGGMNAALENEDEFYYPNYDGTDFTESFKEGFRVAHAYVRQFVPVWR